ncbi:MAG: hypothetical protein WA190_00165 [Usitatibacter sp.]
MSNVETQVQGRHFLHKELWRVVDRQIAHSERFEQGSLYDDMIAMVFAFHALEAYLNYVGELLAPGIWKTEREFFSKQPYRGFDGRFRKVLELCEIAEPSREARPHSTVWLLKSFRDLIAHGKPEHISHIVTHAAGEYVPRMQTILQTLVTKENTYRARDDILSVANEIHGAAKPKIKDNWFGAAGPFEGALGYATGSSRVAT